VRRARTSDVIESLIGNVRPGTSLLEYSKREAPKRNSRVYVIKTSPEQDAAAVAALQGDGDVT